MVKVTTFSGLILANFGHFLRKFFHMKNLGKIHNQIFATIYIKETREFLRNFQSISKTKRFNGNVLSPLVLPKKKINISNLHFVLRFFSNYTFFSKNMAQGEKRKQ